ncbi:MAG TPA: dihydroorotate dehydrogenase [Anaerovoracaceae bacterium]|nr:dihydroorotate dehydrogenase [Anaerovoracaceae bacterium]
MPDLTLTIAGVEWKNPITVCSGTFSAKDSGEFYDINELGAIVTKGVSAQPWEGNPTPRIAETYGGMINSIGLQNPGVEWFIKEELPYLKGFRCPVIVNVVGKTIEEYCYVAEKLSDSGVNMLEVNISCPNIKEGGIGFGTNVNSAARLIKAVRSVTEKPIIVKLSPNVTDIVEIARAVESEGADCLSLINTLLGMRIDVYSKKPVLAMKMGGLSGPPIKPVAVRMVYQVREAVKLPIIGMGGIMTGEDAAEMMLAGANAVAVGTAALIDPVAPIRILESLKEYMLGQRLKSIKDFENLRRLF